MKVLTKEQVQASLNLFQDLRKARVHFNDEDFARYFYDLIKGSEIKTAFQIADILEDTGITTIANKIRDIYTPIAEENIFTKGKYKKE